MADAAEKKVDEPKAEPVAKGKQPQQAEVASDPEEDDLSDLDGSSCASA